MFELLDILGMAGLDWVAIGAAAAWSAAWAAGSYFLMQSLQPDKPKQYPYPEVGGYPLQTSAQGVPIAKIYGTCKVAGNVMWKGPSIPYQVRVGVSGGKDSNEHRKIHYATAYRCSFLIGIGEGPASVSRMWKGKEEQSLTDCTIFSGLDNSGIRALTGETFGDWPNMCCAFFDEYELGGGDALPQFTFEAASGRGPYFAGLHWGASPNDIVVKIGSDGAVDTSWGTSGKWQYDPGHGLATAYCTDLYQMPDGRLLVAHNYLWIDGANVGAGGSLVSCTMLTAAGAIEISWGYKGHYVIWNAAEDRRHAEPVSRLLRDNDGNFHLFAFAGGAGSPFNYHIFDKDGTRLYAHDYRDAGPGERHLGTFHDACFNADKTRIVAVGRDVTTPGTAVPFNTIAFNPTDGSIDTGFVGNTGVAGYALVGTTGVAGQDANAICCVDGGYIVHFDASGVGSTGDYTLTKLALHGRYTITAWGTNGYVVAGSPIYGSSGGGSGGMIKDGNNVWTLCRYYLGGVADSKRQMLRCWDANGVAIQSHDFIAPVQIDNYHNMEMVSGGLVLGTYYQTPANYQFERWTQQAEYVDGVTVTSPSYPAVSIIRAISQYDCNLADIIKDLREHTRYGAGLPAARTDDVSFKACRDYSESKGLLISIAINEQRPVDDWIDLILKHCLGYRFRSNGKFKLGALRDTAPVFTITQDDLLVEDTDNPPPPVRVVKRPYNDTFNDITVMWTDRANGYQRQAAHARDVVDQRLNGVRKRTVELPGIMDPDIAQMIANRLLFEGMYRFSLYSIPVGYKHMLIENGDVGLVSHGGLLVNDRIRILNAQEDKDGRRIHFNAIEDTPSLYPDWRNLRYQTQQSLRADPPTITLADGTVTFREDMDSNLIYLSIAPGNAYTNGWQVYVSYDDATFRYLDYSAIDGVTDGDANSAGTIQGALPAHGTMTWAPDESVLVNIGTVTDLPDSVTEDQFWGDLNLAKIGDEIIAFKTAAETATPGIWQISNLRRGLFGTEAVAHSSGESFRTLNVDFYFLFREVDIGQTVYFKVLSNYGVYTQDIGDVDSFSVTLQGYAQRPGPASLLRLTAVENDGGSGEYSGATFTLYWNLGGLRSGWNYGTPGNVPWNNYLEDPELQAIKLKFEQEDGTPIGDREVAVGNSAVITKATDLGGLNTARIRARPRRVMGSRLENSLLVESI